MLLVSQVSPSSPLPSLPEKISTGSSDTTIEPSLVLHYEFNPLRPSCHSNEAFILFLGNHFRVRTIYHPPKFMKTYVSRDQGSLSPTPRHIFKPPDGYRQRISHHRSATFTKEIPSQSSHRSRGYKLPRKHILKPFPK